MQKIKWLSFFVATIVMLIFIFNLISFFEIKKDNNIAIQKFYDNPKENTYFGILNIPSIKINNVIFNKQDPLNNLNKNILLVSNYNYSFIVLAAHSGNSVISFFKNLYKLGDDEIIFKTNNFVRKYKVFSKIYVEKSGILKIRRYNYPVLILITCSKDYKNKQEVYYARLINSTKFC